MNTPTIFAIIIRSLMFMIKGNDAASSIVAKIEDVSENRTSEPNGLALRSVIITAIYTYWLIYRSNYNMTNERVKTAIKTTK